MLKYFAMVAAVVGSLMIAGEAQAFGRHGCKSCSTGGCPGGNCSVPYAAPGKAGYTNAPPGVTPTTDAPAVVATQPAPASYAYAPARRGLFGRR